MNAAETQQLAYFGRQALFFCVGLLLVWWGLDTVAGHMINSFYELKYAEVTDPRVDADVVIFGSSKVVRGIDPRWLNDEQHTYFNFGYNASNADFYLDWYDLLFRDHYQKPTAIIYAVDWLMFIDGFAWRQFEQDAEFVPLDVLLPAAINGKIDSGQAFFNRFPLIKDSERLGLKLLGQRTDYDYDLMDQYDAGYVPRSAELVVRPFDQPPQTGLPNNPEHVATFLELLDRFKADGIPVILIQIPEYLPETPPDADKLALLRQIADERDLPYLDYNSEIMTELSTNGAYFLDWAHMNVDGATLFSQQLKHDLDRLLPQILSSR